MLFNRRMDPFERAEGPGDYRHRRADHLRAMVSGQAIIDQFLQSLKDYPPLAQSASFSLDQVLQSMQECSPAAIIRFHTRAVKVVDCFGDFA
jgi:arylsulfatase